LLGEIHKKQLLLQPMQQYLSTRPFDLYGLHLFQLIVQHGSFTQAARAAGLSASALTRQMQALERRLGLDLLRRTTRSVEITDAGRYLAAEAARLIGSVTATLDGLQATFGTPRPEVRVSVSRTLAMAHIPGLFHAQQQRQPELLCRISYQNSQLILNALEASECDLGVMGLPPRLPDSVRITHRFKDRFVLLAPANLAAQAPVRQHARYLAWLTRQRWLMIDESSSTGAALGRWLKRQKLPPTPAVALDSFDLIINLVASGYGLAWVPNRALALYRRREALTQLPWPAAFERTVVVVTRKHRQMPEHLTQFIENILF
jgi:DNA-binding transcriptional LysR family regulator